MMHYHFINPIIADEKVLVYDCIVCGSIAVQGVGAGGPQVGPQHMQVLYLFCVARVKLEELLASLRDAFDLRTSCQEDSSFVLGAGDDHAGNLIRKWLC